MSLMQALEGYHRALYEDSYMAGSDYEQVRTTLCNSIPPNVASDHRQSLQSRIRYGNEFSLRKRLEELAKLLSEGMRRRVLGRDGKLPQSWIDTRNYYAHWDEALRSNILSGTQMHYVNTRLRCWIRFLYLLQIGIPEAAIVTALSNPSSVSRGLAHANASG
jgi:hypothetical protein